MKADMLKAASELKCRAHQNNYIQANGISSDTILGVADASTAAILCNRSFTIHAHRGIVRLSFFV
uniref:Uncharacterized protein n=1 Tax=Romanomermis culicivorax TaxID=13658 RepID=A0A915HNI4_ROMCU